MEFEAIMKLLGSVMGGAGGSGMGGGSSKNGQAQMQQYLQQGMSGVIDQGYRDVSGNGGGMGNGGGNMDFQGLMGFLNQFGGR